MTYGHVFPVVLFLSIRSTVSVFSLKDFRQIISYLDCTLHLTNWNTYQNFQDICNSLPSSPNPKNSCKKYLMSDSHFLTMFRGGVVGGDREVLNMTDFINFNYRVTQLNYNMVIPPLIPPPNKKNTPKINVFNVLPCTNSPRGWYPPAGWICTAQNDACFPPPPLVIWRTWSRKRQCIQREITLPNFWPNDPVQTDLKLQQCSFNSLKKSVHIF